MDRFESMTVFTVVADAGSFTAASRAIRLPLATVSRKVSELEAMLKVALLTRSAHGVALTEPGRAYYAECRRLLSELAEAERSASGEYRVPRGDLVITAPIVFGRMHLMPVVVDFLADYPEVAVCVRLSDQIAHLIDERIDLAVRIGALPDSSMIARRVGDIGQVVCASPAYLARHGTPLHPAELIRHACISSKALAVPDRWEFRLDTTPRSFAIARRLAVATAEARIAAAMAGAGLARVLDYQIADAMAQGTLVTVLDNFAPVPAPLNLVYPAARLSPLKLRAFLDFAAPRLQQRLNFRAS